MGVPFMIRHMSNQPLTFEELKQILTLTDDGVDEIISLKSGIYKKLIEEGINFDEMTLSELHYVITKHPTLVRAPIALTDRKLRIGYHHDAYRTFTPREQRQDTHAPMLEILRAEENKKLEQNEMIAMGRA